jgi:hypothetical protein
VTLLLATSFFVAVTGVPMMYLSFAATGKEGYAVWMQLFIGANTDAYMYIDL